MVVVRLFYEENETKKGNGGEMIRNPVLVGRRLKNGVAEFVCYDITRNGVAGVYESPSKAMRDCPFRLRSETSAKSV